MGWLGNLFGSKSEKPQRQEKEKFVTITELQFKADNPTNYSIKDNWILQSRASLQAYGTSVVSTNFVNHYIKRGFTKDESGNEIGANANFIPLKTELKKAKPKDIPPEGAKTGWAIRLNYYITPCIPEKDQPIWSDAIILKKQISRYYANIRVFFYNIDEKIMKVEIVCDDPTILPTFGDMATFGIITPDTLRTFISGIFAVAEKEVNEKTQQHHRYKIERVFFQTLWRFRTKDKSITLGADKDVVAYVSPELVKKQKPHQAG
jgi:hypothetical protein